MQRQLIKNWLVRNHIDENNEDEYMDSFIMHVNHQSNEENNELLCQIYEKLFNEKQIVKTITYLMNNTALIYDRFLKSIVFACVLNKYARQILDKLIVYTKTCVTLKTLKLSSKSNMLLSRYYYQHDTTTSLYYVEWSLCDVLIASFLKNEPNNESFLVLIAKILFCKPTFTATTTTPPCIKSLLSHVIPLITSSSAPIAKNDSDSLLSSLLSMFGSIIKNYTQARSFVPQDKTFYRKLIALLSCENVSVMILSLRCLAALATNNELESKLFSCSNVHYVFQLIFNVASLNVTNPMIMMSCCDILNDFMESPSLLDALEHYKQMKRFISSILDYVININNNDDDDDCMNIIPALHLLVTLATSSATYKRVIRVTVEKRCLLRLVELCSVKYNSITTYLSSRLLMKLAECSYFLDDNDGDDDGGGNDSVIINEQQNDTLQVNECSFALRSCLARPDAIQTMLWFIHSNNNNDNDDACISSYHVRKIDPDLQVYTNDMSFHDLTILHIIRLWQTLCDDSHSSFLTNMASNIEHQMECILTFVSKEAYRHNSRVILGFLALLARMMNVLPLCKSYFKAFSRDMHVISLLGRALSCQSKQSLYDSMNFIHTILTTTTPSTSMASICDSIALWNKDQMKCHRDVYDRYQESMMEAYTYQYQYKVLQERMENERKNTTNLNRTIQELKYKYELETNKLRKELNKNSQEHTSEMIKMKNELRVLRETLNDRDNDIILLNDALSTDHNKYMICMKENEELSLQLKQQQLKYKDIYDKNIQLNNDLKDSRNIISALEQQQRQRTNEFKDLMKQHNEKQHKLEMSAQNLLNVTKECEKQREIIEELSSYKKTLVKVCEEWKIRSNTLVNELNTVKNELNDANNDVEQYMNRESLHEKEIYELKKQVEQLNGALSRRDNVIVTLERDKSSLESKLTKQQQVASMIHQLTLSSSNMIKAGDDDDNNMKPLLLLNTSENCNDTNNNNNNNNVIL